MKSCAGWLCILVGVLLLAAEVRADAPASTRTVVESTPVEKGCVAVSVEARRSAVPADEQPDFVVRFKNLGSDYANLYDVGAYWNWTIRLTNVHPHAPEPGPWRMRMNSIPMRAHLEHRQIKPGESTEIAVNLNDPPFTFAYVYEGKEKKSVPPTRFLKPGRYQVAVTVSLPDFPIGDDKHFWLGPVTTKPIELTIADAPARAETKQEVAAYDVAIAHVTDKLQPHGMWMNGGFPQVNLPKQATAEAVIDMAVNLSILGSKDYRVLRVRPFNNDGASGHAALLRVGKGYKVAVLFPIGPDGWWSRFYDSDLTPTKVPHPGVGPPP